jgi:hypothetical protein
MINKWMMPIEATASKPCKTCRRELPLDGFYKGSSYRGGHRPDCKQCIRERYRARTRASVKAFYAREKDRMLAAYGGACRCCGEARPQFLAIDHIFGDGAEHRRETGRQSFQLYIWLRRRGYPQDRFQLLCHNCNRAKGHRGVCPHVLERAALLDAKVIDVSKAWPFIA